MSREIVWFSAGAASAVAAKLTPDAEIVYCDTSSEHPDNDRFIRDVEEWCGRPVTRLHSDKYADTWDVWRKRRFILGQHGAPCTVELKKKMRYAYQRPDDRQAFGYTADPKEIERAERTMFEQEPGIDWFFPLIDRGITHDDCLALIDRAGIELPVMYRQGYQHNNCIGCPRGGLGYWNSIRRDYRWAFDLMAGLEREYGFATHSEKDGTPIFLDELDPDRGDMATEPTIDCSIICAITELEIEETAP